MILGIVVEELWVVGGEVNCSCRGPKICVAEGCMLRVRKYRR